VLAIGKGLRYYTERAGTLLFARADRSAGNGTLTATVDLLRNGISVFTVTPKPTVAAATFLGPERVPDVPGFVKGDYLQAEILATGGGSGPLRLTTLFEDA
jgi:hypothetical protein